YLLQQCRQVFWILRIKSNHYHMKLVYFAPEAEVVNITASTNILQISTDSLPATTLPDLNREDLTDIWS
ncbi:MAG: hypothetical protein IKZ60_03040, partial [Bacteroidales bacterium]|nr:hypothetical protein [Bacteroidales bacterium]